MGKGRQGGYLKGPNWEPSRSQQPTQMSQPHETGLILPSPPVKSQQLRGLQKAIHHAIERVRHLDPATSCSSQHFFVLTLTGRWLLYNIVVVFAVHQQEYMCFPSHPEPPSHLPPHPIPPACPRAPTLFLLQASNSHRFSISHMVKYMFQSYSLKSSHSLLVPLSPKVCSSHLCLLCCPVPRLVGTIFLDMYHLPIYMC